jgi:hypothetical protein
MAELRVHAAATDLMETEPWDLAAIDYAGIDHFCHRFMRYHAGKRMRGEGTDPAPPASWRTDTATTTPCWDAC